MKSSLGSGGEDVITTLCVVYRLMTLSVRHEWEKYIFKDGKNYWVDDRIELAGSEGFWAVS